MRRAAVESCLFCLYLFLEGFIFLELSVYKSILIFSFLSVVSFCLYGSNDDPSSPMGFDVISRYSSEGATADDALVVFKVVTGDESYYSTVTFFKNGHVTREVVGGPPSKAELIEFTLQFAEKFVMIEKPEQVPVFPIRLPQKRKGWFLWATLMEKIRSFSR